MRIETAACYHGGAFFQAVGDGFDDLSRRHAIVNADVLDAWFDPSPMVLDALREHLPWLLRTSPPMDCAGMVRAIAESRCVDQRSILAGAGSSDLIFLAFTRWLTPKSRVLLIDPTYGEYAHILEHVLGIHVERLSLSAGSGFRLDADRFVDVASQGFDLIVLVNPNSPTGQFTGRTELVAALSRISATTRIWIDETYVDYVGTGESLERFAAASANVIVCKSMSKVYALSGVRAAYLCASAPHLESLRPFVPPWAVSLPAQVAAVHALQDPDYYAARYRETRALRECLTADLRAIGGMEILPGVANFVLCLLEATAPDAAEVVARCREHGVYLRDVGNMGAQIGSRGLRIAVKDASANRKIVDVLRTELCGTGA